MKVSKGTQPRRYIGRLAVCGGGRLGVITGVEHTKKGVIFRGRALLTKPTHWSTMHPRLIGQYESRLVRTATKEAGYR